MYVILGNTLEYVPKMWIVGGVTVITMGILKLLVMLSYHINFLLLVSDTIGE